MQTRFNRRVATIEDVHRVGWLDEKPKGTGPGKPAAHRPPSRGALLPAVRKTGNYANLPVIRAENGFAQKSGFVVG